MSDIAAFFHIAPWPPAPDFLFWILVALVLGALLGEIVFRGMGMPRMVGYSVVGMAIATLGFGVGEGPLRDNVQVVVDLALGVLLFELGSRVSLRWLRVNTALVWTSAAETLVSFGAIYGVLRWLHHDATFALACAALLVSTSGAVIGRVAAELRSSGQVTERMIVLSALNTLYAVLALKLIAGWLYIDQQGDWVQGIAQPLYAFAGSLLVAAVLTKAVALVMRKFVLRDENAAVLLLGLILLAVSVARMFDLSVLLVPLLAGAMLRNTSARPCIWPRHFSTAGGVLVLLLFVIVGSAWSVAAFATGALTALTVIGVRWAGKALVLAATARVSGVETRQGLALAVTLTPVSATTLVLLTELHRVSPGFASQLAPVVLSAIAIMAVAGPIAVQWGLRLAGELQPVENARPGGRA